MQRAWVWISTVAGYCVAAGALWALWKWTPSEAAAAGMFALPWVLWVVLGKHAELRAYPSGSPQYGAWAWATIISAYVAGGGSPRFPVGGFLMAAAMAVVAVRAEENLSRLRAAVSLTDSLTRSPEGARLLSRYSHLLEEIRPGLEAEVLERVAAYPGADEEVP